MIASNLVKIASKCQPLWKINPLKKSIGLVGYQQSRFHGDYPKTEEIQIKWILKDGKEIITPAAIGASLLQVAHHHNIQMEGACEGVCACSTCHVILAKDVYDNLEEPTEKEDDMLDQAFGLTPTSRLGCQVILTAEHNNISVKLPKATRNFYVVRFIS